MELAAFVPADWTTIIQVVAAVVQAGGAMAIVRLTGSLAKSTERYAKTTEDQLAELRDARVAAAKDTERQLGELKMAREAATGDTERQIEKQEQIRLTTLQPYIRVSKADIIFDRVDERLRWPLRMDLSLRNIGPGPAIGVRLVAVHTSLQFQLAWAPFDLESHEDNQRVGLLAVEFQPAQGQPLDPIAGVRIEYRDLFGRFWMTTTRVGIEGLQIEKSQITSLKAVLRDQDELVEQIHKLYIRQDTLEPLEKIEANLRVGVITTKN